MTDIEKRIADNNGTTNDTLRDKYEALVLRKIRRKYTLAQELSVQRKRDSHPEEFAEMDAYIEQCIAEAKVEIYGGDAE